MEKDIFAPYEIAKQLKEIGFDQDTIAIYYKGILYIDDFIPSINSSDDQFSKKIELSNPNSFKNIIAIPTYEQVFKWFREKGLNFQLIQDGTSLKWYAHIKNKRGEQLYPIRINEQEWKYEDARHKGILELIKIYKDESEKI